MKDTFPFIINNQDMKSLLCHYRGGIFWDMEVDKGDGWSCIGRAERTKVVAEAKSMEQYRVGRIQRIARATIMKSNSERR